MSPAPTGATPMVTAMPTTSRSPAAGTRPTPSLCREPSTVSRGFPCPRSPGGESLLSAWWWLYVGAAVVASAAIIAWQWRRKRHAAAVAVPTSPPDDTGRPDDG